MLRIKFAVTALLLFPLAAIAVPVKYVVTGEADDWTLTGEVVLDDEDLMAGENLVEAFIDWGFSWTDGTDTLVADPSTSSLDPSENFFEILADLSVGEVSLCPGACLGFGGSPTWPDIFVEGDPEEGYFWDASIPPREPEGCCVRGEDDDDSDSEAESAIWSGPMDVTVAVPEPGTLALLGIGLVGMGLARRRKTS